MLAHLASTSWTLLTAALLATLTSIAGAQSPPQSVIRFNGVVCIDPGHGGDAPGATCGLGTYPEKTLNLTVALALGDLLVESGSFAWPAMVRVTDITIPYNQRPALMRSLYPDIWVSVHHNGTDSFGSPLSAGVLYQSNSLQAGALPWNKVLAWAIYWGLDERWWQWRFIPAQDQPCEVNIAHCAGTSSYAVLGGNTIPAIIGEGASACLASAQRVVTNHWEAEWEAEGYAAGIMSYYGVNAVAFFHDESAYGDSAYCRTLGESKSRFIILRGYHDPADYPYGGQNLALLPAAGGLRCLRTYRAYAPTSFSTFAWIEVDSAGTETPSRLFARTEQPAWADSVFSQETWCPPLDRFAPPTGAVVTTPTTCATADAAAADIVVYAHESAMGAPIYDQVVSDCAALPNNKVRLIVGAATVEAFRDSLRTVLDSNRHRNACSDSLHAPSRPPFPSTPGPEVYLVSEMDSSHVDAISFRKRSQIYGCQGPTCLSDLLLYDTDGDSLPDGPLSRIPATTSAEAISAALTAQQFNNGINVTTSRRTLFMTHASRDSISPDSVLIQVARQTYARLGYLLSDVLNASNYSLPEQLPLKQEAYRRAMAAGVNELFAHGGVSDNIRVPGDFMTCPSALGERPQRVVAWLPGCGVHALWVGRSNGTTACLGVPQRSLIEQYLFAPATGTSIAASVSSVDFGPDFAHREMARILLAEREAASEAGGASVARVVYNAVTRAIQEKPWLRDHALSFSALGSYVVVGAPQRPCACEEPQFHVNRTAYPQGTRPAIVACPAGDLDSARVTLRAACMGGLVDSVDATLVRIDNWQDDVRFWPSLGDTLYPTRFDSSSGELTFDFPRAASGCGGRTYQPYLRGEPMGQPVSFYVKTLDVDPRVWGSVDRFDIQRMEGMLCQDAIDGCLSFAFKFCPDPSCGIERNPGQCQITRRDIDFVAAHSGHHPPRPFLRPAPGDTVTIGAEYVVRWTRQEGDSAIATVYLTRESRPGRRTLISPWAMPDSGALLWRVRNLDSLGTDFRLHVVRCVGYREAADALSEWYPWAPADSSAYFTVLPGVAGVTLSHQTVASCPAGDGDTLRVYVRSSATVPPTYVPAESLVLVPRQDGHVTVWDSSGNHMLEITGRVEPDSGSAVIVFELARLSGCGAATFDVIGRGSPVARGVQVDVRSLDTDGHCLGSVDKFDRSNWLTLWGSNDKCPPSCCGDFDGDGILSLSSDMASLGVHRGHALRRPLTSPTASQVLAYGDFLAVGWKRALGDSARVSLYLLRGSDPTNRTPIAENLLDAGSYTWPAYVADTPRNDYQVEVVHTAGYYVAAEDNVVGRDTSAAFTIEANPGGGCPFVDTKTAAGWVVENSILGRSLSGTVALDDYRLKALPDASGGQIQVRVRENEQEYTTLDEVRLVAVDHAPEVGAFALGSRVVVGTKLRAERATTAAGTDVTNLVDGSGAYFVGEPGETLLVDMTSSQTARARLAHAGDEGGVDPLIIDDGGKDSPPPIRGPVVTDEMSARRTDAMVLEGTGILIQAPDGQGGWRTVMHRYPREDFDEVTVDSIGSGPVRLVFVGRHRVRYIGKLNVVADSAVGQSLTPLLAQHSRLGDVLRTGLLGRTVTALLQPGDTLSLAFSYPELPAGQTRDLFLFSRGVYTSSAPARMMPSREVPTRFALHQNQPNPFATRTTIRFDLPTPSRVEIEVFDLQGRRVRTLARSDFAPGFQSVTWDRRDQAGNLTRPGVYLYRMQAGSFRAQKKMVLLP